MSLNIAPCLVVVVGEEDGGYSVRGAALRLPPRGCGPLHGRYGGAISLEFI